MVKGYDPTTDDAINILFRYLKRSFIFQSPLSVREAKQMVLDWIQHSDSTSKLYDEFESLKVSPSIILRKKCRELPWPFAKPAHDERYPAFTSLSAGKAEISLCLNHMRNKVELKQNLDRELAILYQLASPTKVDSTGQQVTVVQGLPGEEKDFIFMGALYKGCLKGYRNYQLEQEVETRISKKCAKYLFRRRVQTDKPQDYLFRYASRLIDMHL